MLRAVALLSAAAIGVAMAPWPAKRRGAGPNIVQAKCRGNLVGYRVYVGQTYHSYHKTQALAKIAVAEIARGLGSTPRPKSSSKEPRAKAAVAEIARGLGSTPRPKSSSKEPLAGSKAKELGSTPRLKPEAKRVLKGDRLKGAPPLKTQAGLRSTPRLKTMAGLKGDPRPQAVLFKGLVPKFSARSGKWSYRAVVRQAGTDCKLYVGTYDNQRDAASNIAKVMGHETCALERKKCNRRPVMETMQRFKLLAAIFKGWCPRDVTGAVKRRGKAAMMMVQAPGMYVAFLMGREHSWRDAVLKTWEATDCAQRLLVAGLDSNDEPVRVKASKAMHDILRGAFSEWAKETSVDPEQREEWKAHVDRNVGFHLSLTAWGCREGLLNKSCRATSLGIQNKKGQRYGLCVYNKWDHHAKMLQLHRLGRMLLQMQVPRTNREWLGSINKFGLQCSEAGINSGQTEDNYQFWWLARLHLIVEMRHQGIQQLRVVMDWDKDQVAAAMVPDMSEWLITWMASKDCPTLKTLLSKLAYREPLEMLSCFCCILGDNEIDQHSTEVLESARDAICKQRRQMREASSSKDEANPAIIIRKALAA